MVPCPASRTSLAAGSSGINQKGGWPARGKESDREAELGRAKDLKAILRSLDFIRRQLRVSEQSSGMLRAVWRLAALFFRKG